MLNLFTIYHQSTMKELTKTEAWYRAYEELIFQLEDHPHKDEILALCEEQLRDDQEGYATNSVTD